MQQNRSRTKRVSTNTARPGIRAIVAAAGFIAGLASLTPAPLLATSLAECPVTVVQNTAFPSGLYACSETDNVWFAFEDIGAVTGGMTALPAGTIFHIDPVQPDEVVITVEPGGASQFLPGTLTRGAFIWRRMTSAIHP